MCFRQSPALPACPGRPSGPVGAAGRRRGVCRAPARALRAARAGGRDGRGHGERSLVFLSKEVQETVQHFRFWINFWLLTSGCSRFPPPPPPRFMYVV